MYEPIVCPDCRQGKHFNCTDEAWSEEFENVTNCDCKSNDHMRPTSG